MDDLLRVPPQSIEAEQSVLGAILLDNDALLKAKQKIEPSDFYKTSHRKIYSAMMDLTDIGEPIDIITLTNRLQKLGGTDEVGGVGYLASLFNMIPTAANISSHADIVKEKALKRNALQVCQAATNKLYEDAPIDEVLSDLRNGMGSLVKNRGTKIVSTYEMAKNLSEFIERRSRNRSELSGIPSGFHDLDELTDGWQKTEQIIIAGRPGAGKSAFALQCAENAGVPVGIISIEMGEHQLGIRQLSKMSRVELWRIRKGILSNAQWPVIQTTLARLADLPLYFAFTSHTLIEIERAFTQMIEVHGCKMIILDYLQLAQGSDRNLTREREVAKVSQTTKLLAKSNNIPVISISSMNRAIEKREDKRPTLADLRESGAIEYDGDIIIFLHRQTKDATSVVEVIVEKGKNCGTGIVKLLFNGDTMTFNDLTEERQLL